MPSERPRGAWLNPLADGALFAACVCAPLAVGGVYLWSQELLLMLVGVALVASMLNQRRRGHRISVPLLAALPASFVVLCALQLLPLPPAMLRVLSPTGYEMLDTTLTPLGALGWHSVSLDPPATALELGKALLYLLLVVAACVRGREPHGGRMLLAAVAWSGVATLMLAAVHTLGNMSRPYGMFGGPSNSFLTTPFVNPNHAAGFFGIATFAAAGLALSQRDRARTGLWSLAAILLAAAVPLTLSRGGILALVATLLFGAWLVYARTRSERATLWWVHLGVGLAIAVAAYLAYQPIAAELATLDPGDLQGDKRFLWREALAMVPSFAGTGTGRGAFARVFPAFKSNAYTASFEFAESAPIQWLADFGMVAGGALLLAVALAFALAVRRAWQRRRAAALAALFFALVHNLVDFNLEIPGVAIPLLLVAVMLSDRRRDEAAAPRPIRLGVPVPLALGTGLVLIALATMSLRHGHLNDGRVLDGQIAATRDPARLGALAARGLRQHPTDYLYALTMARAHLAGGPEDRERGLRWLNRSLRLNPTHGLTHRLIARTLWVQGVRLQALESWRRAVALQPAQKNAILGELLKLDAQYPELASGLPAVDAMALCTGLRARQRRDEAWACLLDHLERNPQDADALAVGTGWAVAEGDTPRGDGLVQRLLDSAPRDARGPLYRGQILLRQGQAAEAIATWEQALDQVDEPAPLLHALFERALRDRRFVEARECLDRLRRHGSPSPGTAAQHHHLAGRLYLAQDLPARALREFETALALSTASASYLQAVADTEQKLGRLDRALEHYQTLRRQHPNLAWVDQRIRAIEELRAKRETAARWQQVREPDAGAAERTP
ncbi:MAG: O-antigen ligase family protein [Pseudomonadota bacterium]